MIYDTLLVNQIPEDNLEINGKTKVIVHLAYPSTHLRTPSFFNPLMEEQRRNAVLVPWQVSPENLPQVWEALRISESVAGVIVTIPHKTSVAGLCDRLEGAAKFLNVANVARKTDDGQFIGHMYDGPGYLQGLKSQGHEMRGRSVLLLGAGGAATGIAHSMVEEGVARLTIANRTRAKAKALADALNAEFGADIVSEGEAAGGDHDVIINATSVGLKESDPLPIDPETIRPDALVGEVIMQPDITPLLLASAARGCQIHKGKFMILGQTQLLAEFILGPI